MVSHKRQIELEEWLCRHVQEYQDTCKKIEDINLKFPELEICLSDPSCYNDPTIMEFNALDRRRVELHDEILRIFKELGVNFKSKKESHDFIMGG